MVFQMRQILNIGHMNYHVLRWLKWRSDWKYSAEKDQLPEKDQLLHELLEWFEHPQLSTWPYVEGQGLCDDVDKFTTKLRAILGIQT